jgi:hypothetical protein
MKHIQQHFSTPRVISSDWKSKIYPDTPLYNNLMYAWLAGIVLSIVCAALSYFGMKWTYTFIVIGITAAIYLYYKSIEKSALLQTEKILINAQLSYAGFCTYWSRIFSGEDGLAVLVYSTNPVLAKDENYIKTIRDNIAAMLDGEVAVKNEKEKDIYNKIRNDDKGRYKINDKELVPESLGSKGETYLCCAHFNADDLPKSFNPEEQLWGLFINNGNPLQLLSSSILKP